MTSQKKNKKAQNHQTGTTTDLVRKLDDLAADFVAKGVRLCVGDFDGQMLYGMSPNGNGVLLTEDEWQEWFVAGAVRKMKNGWKHYTAVGQKLYERGLARDSAGTLAHLAGRLDGLSGTVRYDIPDELRAELRELAMRAGSPVRRTTVVKNGETAR